MSPRRLRRSGASEHFLKQFCHSSPFVTDGGGGVAFLTIGIHRVRQCFLWGQPLQSQQETRPGQAPRVATENCQCSTTTQAKCMPNKNQMVSFGRRFVTNLRLQKHRGDGVVPIRTKALCASTVYWSVQIWSSRESSLLFYTRGTGCYTS
jgi:hypothetical protein